MDVTGGHDAAWLADQIGHLAGRDQQRISALAWRLYGRGYNDGHAALADALTDGTHPWTSTLSDRVVAEHLRREHISATLRSLAHRGSQLELTILRREDFLPALAQHQRIWDGWAPGKTA